ncbi:hypothetical protein HRH59_03415 [Rheinheimera sp. YQF-2]|uniref:Uncharacterized protein n=1 Tax=Rheinheimera lutimaris TaxID=2740584 RepID=A0A7Y5ANJ9_9GAMM|nr:hypothetical protein [Rheinheimera lutimaris]NRQ41617.1 hypothetical protein [Rheinheimera lutimaris]
MSFWQHGRFEPQPEFDFHPSHFISLECPDAGILKTLALQGEELEPELVLIRLACDVRMQKNAAAEQLRKAMLAPVSQDQQTVAASAWPWLDNALTHTLQNGRLPYTDSEAFPAEFRHQLEQALCWTAEHIYPPDAEYTDDDDDWDEQQQQDARAHSLAVAKQLYRQFNQVLLATLLMQQLQPQHPALQQIALNHNASFTHFVGLELALRRQAQYHCMQHFGKDWFWQHLDQLELQHIFYLAARCRFEPGEILALQIKLENECAGLEYFISRKECIAALTELSLAVEFGFEDQSEYQQQIT